MDRSSHLRKRAQRKGAAVTFGFLAGSDDLTVLQQDADAFVRYGRNHQVAVGRENELHGRKGFPQTYDHRLLPPGMEGHIDFVDQHDAGRFLARFRAEVWIEACGHVGQVGHQRDQSPDAIAEQIDRQAALFRVVRHHFSGLKIEVELRPETWFEDGIDRLADGQQHGLGAVGRSHPSDHFILSFPHDPLEPCLELFDT